MARQGVAYQRILDGLYRAIAVQCEDFRGALIATGDGVLSHSIGISDQTKTVLTEAEFCTRLVALRGTLRSS